MNASTLARDLAVKAATSIGAPVSEVVRRPKSLAWILGRLRKQLPGTPDAELRAIVRHLPRERFDEPELAPAPETSWCPWCGNETGGTFCDSLCRDEYAKEARRSAKTDPQTSAEHQGRTERHADQETLRRAACARGHEASLSQVWSDRAHRLQAILNYSLRTNEVIDLAAERFKWTRHVTQSTLSAAEDLGLVLYGGTFWHPINDGGLDG